MILYHKKQIKQIKCRNKVRKFLQFFTFWTIIDYVLYVINLFMKTKIVQLWQLVLKYKKRIIYGALVLLALQICFFDVWWIGIQNEVFAEEQQTASQNTDFNAKATEWLDSFTFFKKVIYVILYPLLALMWKLVDNSLVYGEVFHFDIILWNLWNIVRNLANFALWFIFVYKIFEYLIKGQKSWEVKKLLISSLIAWIWIQASWFIMAALLDVSTVLTYGIWWLPLSTLGTSSVEQGVTKDGDKKNTNEYNPYVWQTNISIDVDNFDIVPMYMSNNPSEWKEKVYISVCDTFDYSGPWSNKEQLLLAPKYLYYKYNNQYMGTQSNMCHYDGQVYYFDGFVKGISWWTCSSYAECISAQNYYDINIKSVTTTLLTTWYDEIRQEVINGHLLQIWNAHASWWIQWNVFTGIVYSSDKKLGLDVNNEWSGESETIWWLKRLKDIWNGSYVWVFSSLYASLLNAWFNLKVANESDSSLFVNTLNALLSLGHMLAIAIPLLAMMVVCVMRIWVLWMAIILSPVIVLMKAFWWEKVFEKWKEPFTYLTVDNLIRIIFAPVILCFAISISTVLVRVIENVNWQDVQIANTTDDIMWWLVQVAISNASISLGKLIFAAVWVAITWFLVWAAIQSSKLWESGIIKWLKEYATSALWSIPVVPVPTKDGFQMVGAGSVIGENWVVNQAIQQVKNTYSKNNTAAVDALLNPNKTTEIQANKMKLDSYTTQLLAGDVMTGRTNKEILVKSEDGKQTESFTFAAMSADQKKDVIDAINAQSEEKRKKLDNLENIIIDGKTYTWTKNYKYEEANSSS